MYSSNPTYLFDSKLLQNSYYPLPPTQIPYRPLEHISNTSLLSSNYHESPYNHPLIQREYLPNECLMKLNLSRLTECQEKYNCFVGIWDYYGKCSYTVEGTIIVQENINYNNTKSVIFKLAQTDQNQITQNGGKGLTASSKFFFNVSELIREQASKFIFDSNSSVQKTKYIKEQLDKDTEFENYLISVFQLRSEQVNWKQLFAMSEGRDHGVQFIEVDKTVYIIILH